jgi:hypothetical protein
MTKTACSLLAAVAFSLVAASAAQADCITGGQKTGHAPMQALGHPRVLAYDGRPGAIEVPDSIVGMWVVTFFFGDGPDVFDHGLEQFHADGTEITMDVAVPPAAGNVCLGVWEKTATRSVKLHHLGFNWDTSANPATLAGLFVLDMTVTLGRGGDSFSGHYVTDSFDNDGVIIPSLHAEGTVRAQRVQVH